MSAFDPARYGPTLAPLLSPRLMPLDAGRPDAAMRAAVAALDDRAFGRPVVARAAAAACRAGLYLLHDCLDEAHTLSQDLSTAEGSFWHAIMHRREPDYPNAKYWFRRVGEHPIFRALAGDAAELGYLGTGMDWEPFVFVDHCEELCGKGGEEETLRRVQRAEWELLFEYCFRRAVGA
jgi:hypothetical protein